MAAPSEGCPPIIESRLPVAEGCRRRTVLVLMRQPVYAEMIVNCTPFDCCHARNRREALAALDAHDLHALLALSPDDEPGSAGAVIREFRARFPGGLTIYHGCDYRLEVSGARALECGADVLVAGGMLVSDFLRLLLTTMVMKTEGSLPPPSQEWYDRLLRELCRNSAFWKSAEMLRECGAPASACY